VKNGIGTLDSVNDCNGIMKIGGDDLNRQTIEKRGIGTCPDRYPAPDLAAEPADKGMEQLRSYIPCCSGNKNRNT